MTGATCIQMPESDGPCAFCAYLSGEREYAIAVRGALVAVLVTQEVRGEPHLLVVPIRHCETVLDLSDNEVAEVMMAVRDVAQAIDSEYCRPGIAVWQNNGAPAHQAIGHMHVHVAGTIDGGGTRWGEVSERPLAEAQEVAQRLRPKLDSRPWVLRQPSAPD